MEDNTNIMSGDLNALKQFRDMVSSYNEAVQNSAGCASDEKRLEKDLLLNRKNLKDNIDSTVKKRRSEVQDKFDEEISKDKDKLKRIQNRRGKAKDKGVKGRIAEETADLVKQNSELKKNIGAALKENRLPGFCGSGFYFTLYYTKGAAEVFICAMMIVLMFLLMPAAIYIALPLEKLPERYTIPAFAITYFVVIVIVFFVYKIIGDRTKHKHEDELRAVRALRDRINSNKKQISNIARSITKDKNEDMYGLEDYDAQIRDIEEDIAKITADKEEALKNFDNNASAEIASEIENREMPRINGIEEDYNAAVKLHAELDEQVRQLGLKISTDYEAYLGKEFTDTVKIDELIAIMETGKASTVSEAVNEYNKK